VGDRFKNPKFLKGKYEAEGGGVGEVEWLKTKHLQKHRLMDIVTIKTL